MTTDGGDRIKSAYERAMERVANLEKPSQDQQLQWKGTPEGTRIAAAYMKDGGDLVGELAKVGKELLPFVRKGVVEVLIANLQLPRNDAGQRSTTRAIEGLRAVLRSKAMDEVAGRVTYVCDQYRTYGAQQKQQIMEQLKQQFAGQLQEALRRQGLPPNSNVTVEQMPEFQQEWLRAKARLESQYEEHLEAFRGEIQTLAKK